MTQQSKLQLGEEVFHRQTQRKAKIVDLTECSENGKVEHVEIQYQNGHKEWIPADKVAKLLTEYTPKISGQNLIQD